MDTGLAILICAIAIAVTGSMIWYELANIRQDAELMRANIQQYVASKRTLIQLQLQVLTLRKDELELRSMKRQIDMDLRLKQMGHDTDAIRYCSKISPLTNDRS